MGGTQQVSVVVTTLNRARTLPQILAPLLRDPATGEVVVVSDASTDRTEVVLADLAAKDPRVEPLLLIDNVGQPRARMAGVRHARHGIVLSLDDDVLVADGAVSAHLARHRAADTEVVLGFMPSPDVAGWQSPAGWNYATHYLERTAAWQADPARVLETFWAGHFSVKRDPYVAALEGYDFGADYHEDLELGLQLQRSGLRGAFAPEIRSTHLYDRSYEQSLNDARRSGKGLRLLENTQGRDPSADLPDEGGAARKALVAAALRTPATTRVALGATRAGVRLGHALKNDTVALKAARLGWQVALLEGYRR